MQIRYSNNEESLTAQSDIKWANSILEKPDYEMPNGKMSHQVAYEALNRAHDILLDHIRVTAY